MIYDAPVSDANGNLLSFIAATVETMRDQMATKADLAELRDRMATKADLAELRDQMATKAELAAFKDETKVNLAEIRKLMATKSDVSDIETRINIQLSAIRGDIEQVQLRLDSIDRSLSGRIGLVETDVSRLRSVLYLLVKDRPDMLRLLGQSTLPGTRAEG